ncbi:MAG: hypothetical protein AB1586_21010 [Pseudomonadota bacterium]|jgi:hypothetical protein
MANSKEIETIRADFASKYSINLDELRNDAKTLSSLVSQAQAGAIDSSRIYEEGQTYSSAPENARIPDLEDQSYADMPIDIRLSPRRVEQNLEEAARYSQAAWQLRQQYADIAKLRNDTRFKGEEFVRLDMVHCEEVAAGLYKMPWQEAGDDRAGLEIAVEHATRQRDVPDEMMRDGASGKPYSALLTADSIKKYVDDSSVVAKYTAPSGGDAVYGAAQKTNAYRSNIEFANWTNTSASTNANLAQLKSRLATARRKEEYLRKDEVFRSHRAAISRQIAWIQIVEHCRSRSILNYSERLAVLKTLYQTNLLCLTQRVAAIVPALKTYYNVDLSFEGPAAGQILDYLSKWLIAAQDELSRVKRSQTTVVRSFWSGSGAIATSAADSGADSTPFFAEINVDEKSLPAGRRLLRGVAFEYLGDEARPLVLDVAPPAGVLQDPGMKSVTFGRVCQVSASTDLKPQQPDVFWNANPSGAWKVSGLVTRGAKLVDIGLYLWIAS